MYRDRDRVAADLTGLSIRLSMLNGKQVAGPLAKPEDDIKQAGKKAAGALARTLAEAVPQILLQGSLLMARGKRLVDQPLLVTSLALSLLTAIRKSCELTSGFFLLLDKMRDAMTHRPPGDMCQTCLFFPLAFALAALPTATLWLLIAFAALRVLMIQLCPCHSWGIGTGCNVLPLA